jgi:two-component system chemotaxis response regulator CheB
MTEKIRVLVVDDSAFARQVVRRVLERASDIQIVDIARDGAEALEKVALFKPDVVTLDLVMPGIDGLGVLEALPGEGGPRVVVVSSAGSDTDLGAAALAAGAVDLVLKPTTQATDRLYEMADELIDRVRVAARARPLAPLDPAALPPARAVAPASTRVDVVVLGTSTGGPQALARLLPQLPGDFPVPVVIVVHLPPGYTDSLAHRLGGHSAVSVLEAHDGLVLTAGMAVIAPHGAHLRIARRPVGLRVELDYLAQPGDMHRPSADALFSSAAEATGARCLGVVLTGMGHDGLQGAQRVHDAGGRIIAQDEATSVVWGMPRAIVEAGLADEVAPLHRMIETIIRCVSG